MMKTLQKIFHLLALEGKKQLYWLILAVVVMAVLDMVGVASIFPFLNVIADPAIIQENAKLKWLYDSLRFSSRDAFLVALGTVSFVILLLSNLLHATVSIALIRFSYVKRYIISKALLAKYLHEPYSFFLNRNTSELTAYLVSEVARVVSGVLIPCLQVLARSLMALAIVALLVTINSVVALAIIMIVGGGYGMIYSLVRKILTRAGKGITEYSKKIYKSLHEAFGGIKDIKLLGKEGAFIDRFSGAVQKINDCYCRQYVIFQFPRYAFEVLVFGGILFIAVYIAVLQKNYQGVIPLVGVYAFAAYRLMPTLQQIYLDLANIRSSLPALDVVYQDFILCVGDETDQGDPVSRLPFAREIGFHNITFRYPKAQDLVIENLNLTIKRNTTVGLVGGSGAGKTTLIDILLGLLRPTGGSLVVDGLEIDEKNLRQWQENIGYVPQQIYLADDTVTRNIAFGVLDEKIDHEAVQYAARLANIHEFVTRELPKGYATEVGEHGVRLSGGQRQRIGIARALYHDPLLLVFDEATSALDGITEDVILEAIYNLAHKKTIILIAHRLSTVQECDVIYMLERGKISGQGTYDELVKTNRQFREMAKIGAEARI
jgi:ABC-type multidrug transport system fused ATPase/permease subunit